MKRANPALESILRSLCIAQQLAKRYRTRKVLRLAILAAVNQAFEEIDRLKKGRK